MAMYRRRYRRFRYGGNRPFRAYGRRRFYSRYRPMTRRRFYRRRYY